jgi:hypothetical protein
MEQYDGMTIYDKAERKVIYLYCCFKDNLVGGVYILEKTYCLHHYTFKETVGSSPTLIPIFEAIRHEYPEDYNINLQSCENLRVTNY